MRKSGGRQRDPLVAINQEVLSALLEDRGWTVATLARRTGDLEQTLAHTLKTPGARCKKSRRARIAKVLQVPQELLAGESFPIPLGFMAPDGFEFRYSARTELAASRFVARVRTALLRDLRTHSPKSESISYLPPNHIEGAVLSAFSEFMMVGEWRKRFIEFLPEEMQRRGYTEPATIDPWEGDVRITNVDKAGRVFWEASPPRRERDADHEAAILALVRSMEHILEPWFGGTARLNYRAIRDFTHLPNHPFANLEEKDPSTSPFAILAPAEEQRVPSNAAREKKPERSTTRKRRIKKASEAKLAGQE